MVCFLQASWWNKTELQCKPLPESMWILRLKAQESQSFASCSSGVSLCFSPWGQLRWHQREWTKPPGTDMAFSCGICRNVVKVFSLIQLEQVLWFLCTEMACACFLVDPPHSCVTCLPRGLGWAGCRCSAQACAMTILKTSALLAPPVHQAAMPQPKGLPKTTSIYELGDANGPPVPICHLHKYPEPLSLELCCSFPPFSNHFQLRDSQSRKHFL